MGWGIKKAFKPMKDGLRSIAGKYADPREQMRAVDDVYKANVRSANDIYKRADNEWKGIDDTFKVKMPDIPADVAPGAPAPDAEVGTFQNGADENISRRKRKNRNALRIDLNAGGGDTGNGVNLPVG